jgi:Tfp pilus assembly protein PilO
MDLSSLGERLLRLLPLLIILMAIMGLTLFAIRSVLPAWRDYEALATAVATQELVVETLIAAQNDNDNLAILERQISSVEEDLQAASSIFLTEAEAEEVLNRLYGYAYSRGVRIVNLQAQPPATAVAAPYDTTIMQLQVNGGVANLIDFIAHVREASLPSVNIETMNVVRSGDQATLTMVLLLYTSPYASGETLSQIPSPGPSPTPTEPPTPTLTPTETPVTLEPMPTYTTTATLGPTKIPPTLTPSLTPTPVPTSVECPGAPATLFTPGDTAIVDFNELGALRVFSDPNGNVLSTRTQAYDNHVLEIVAGPVCVNNSYYWYVRNLSQDNALGWVAEAQGSERWLCPENNPECTD